MATKKSTKSSKTAHVMNVLSGIKQEGTPSRAPATAAPTEAPPAPIVQTSEEVAQMNQVPEAPQQTMEAQAAPQLVRAPLRSPLLEVARATDEAVSASIRDSLEEALELELLEVEAESELAPSLEAPMEEKGKTPQLEGLTKDVAQAQTPGRLKAALVPPISAPQTAPEREASQEKNQADDKAAGEAARIEQMNHDYCYVNVMQVMVEEKAAEYVDMFQLCRCARCMADVKALALSALPSEYVVMHKGELVPRLSVYEGRHAQAITAQLFNACKLVQAKPRHDT